MSHETPNAETPEELNQLFGQDADSDAMPEAEQIDQGQLKALHSLNTEEVAGIDAAQQEKEQPEKDRGEPETYMDKDAAEADAWKRKGWVDSQIASGAPAKYAVMRRAPGETK